MISVIIATFDRPKQIESCLGALSRLNFEPSNFEVIVVDDGSPRPIDAIVESFSGKLNVRLIRQENAGPASARNNAVEHSVGEFLIFTDDDCSPDPSWLATATARLEKSPESLVGGKVVNSLKNDCYAGTSQMLVDYLYDYYHGTKRPGAFLTSNNFACSSAAFRAIGGFDSRFPKAAAEDRDFSDRWVQAGNPLLFAPEMIVQHAHALDARKFFQQHFNYGRGAFLFHKLKAKRTNSRLRFEPFYFYMGLFSYPFSQSISKYRVAQTVVLLAMSQFANALGFFTQAFIDRGSTAPSGEEEGAVEMKPTAARM
jgi:GT2 family glycosyltransferase